MLTHNDWKLTHRKLHLPRLPKGFDGLRIAQLSDLHFYEYTDPAYYRTIIDATNELAPDVIFMTGDVVHYGNKYLPLAAEHLSRLDAKIDKYAVLGNHDHHDGGKGRHVAEMLTELGFEVLVNENTVLTHPETAERLWIAGVDDWKNGKPDLEAALTGVPSTEEATILLSHNPLMFDPVHRHPRHQVDLVVSGHTHAGHVYIPILWLIYRYVFQMKYRYGLFQRGKTQLHVTSGVGSAAFYVTLPGLKFGFPRFRYNTHPEIACLELCRSLATTETQLQETVLTP